MVLKVEYLSFLLFPIVSSLCLHGSLLCHIAELAGKQDKCVRHCHGFILGWAVCRPYFDVARVKINSKVCFGISNFLYPAEGL